MTEKTKIEVGVDDAVVVFSPECDNAYGLTFHAPKSITKNPDDPVPVHLLVASQIVHFISDDANLRIINDYFEKTIMGENSNESD